MSSISLRSYRLRRKSAEARLETPAVREDEPRRPERSRRVKSALETRREHESSKDVFPEAETTKIANPTWGISRYTEDYGRKTPVPPVPMRPISPTRRNNPHPSQPFLIWKYPVRIHEHQKAVPPHPDTWRFIHEGFYEDYTDNYNTGDAKKEVGVTNLAKAEFPGKVKKNGYTSTPQLITGISGMKAKLNPRQSQKDIHSLKPPKPPSPQSCMIQAAVKGSTLPYFKEWLKKASSKERDVVLQMLHVAHDNSEGARLQKAVADVLNPESAERVQDWLKNTNQPERQILLHVLETLAIAAGDSDQNVVPEESYNFHYPRAGHRQKRSRSCPVSLHHRPSQHYDRSHYSSSGQYSRHLPQHLSHSHPFRSKHSAGNSSSGPKGLQSDIGLIGKQMVLTKAVKEEKSKAHENTEIWHHRIKKHRVGATIFHAGSTFQQTNKDRGQHFAIHPEWPIA